MEKKQTFLSCYNEWIKEGKLPRPGLCTSLPNELFYNSNWQLIRASTDERYQLYIKNFSSTYWADGRKRIESSGPCDFTPLRQTIMLLAACLNDEL